MAVFSPFINIRITDLQKINTWKSEWIALFKIDMYVSCWSRLKLHKILSEYLTLMKIVNENYNTEHLSAKRLVRVLNYLFAIHSLIWISLYESFYLINKQMYHSTQRLIQILVINSTTMTLFRLSVDTCCYRLWHNDHSPYLLCSCHHIITITNKLMTSIVFLEIKDAWIYCKIYLAFTLIWHALI